MRTLGGWNSKPAGRRMSTAVIVFRTPRENERERVVVVRAGQKISNADELLMAAGENAREANRW